jgi:predicted metal-binding protein
MNFILDTNKKGYSTMETVKNIALLSNEDSDKFDIELGYVLIRCKKCHSSWGATPVNGIISKRSFVCRNCAKEKVYEEMVSNKE